MSQNVLPSFDTPANRAALARQHAFGPEVRRKVLAEKWRRAAAEWAQKKMGHRFEEYLGAALWYFFLLLTLRLTKHPSADPRIVLEHTSYVIPQTLPKKGGFLPPRTSGEGFLTLDVLKKQYELIYERVLKVKNETKYKAQFGLALKEALPGIPISDTYGTTRASDIALDYLAWKYYKQRIDRASVKKLLVLARHPDRLSRVLEKELERHYGQPIESLLSL